MPMSAARSGAPIVIAGAGIAGLCTALGLIRAGFKVIVLEQAAELREAGAGVSLAPNATRALISLGVGDALRRVGQVPNRASIRHYQTGAELSSYNIGDEMEQQWGAPYLQLPRTDLQLLLLEAVKAAAPGALRLNSRVQSVTHLEAGVHIVTNDDSIEAPCLLAADGVRSAIRSKLFAQPEPHFMGYVAWRGLLPMESIKYSPLSPDTVLYLGPNRSMLRYKMRGSSVMNFVAFAQDNNWSEEGWSVPADPEDIRAAFGDWNDEAAALTSAMCNIGGAFKWGLFGRPQLSTWRQGRVMLVGDAAHPLLPFLGQGAAMAIEDGVVLARAFELSKDIDTALGNYERARYERATTIVRRADRQGLRIHEFLAAGSTSTEVPRDDFYEFGFDAAAVTFDA
jgi:salicylate hydroxylase